MHLRHAVLAIMALGLLAGPGKSPSQTLAKQDVVAGDKVPAPAREKESHKRTFADFLAQTAKPMKPEDASAAAGHYQRYCSLCHGDDRQGHVNDDAPSLRSKSLLASGFPGPLSWAISYGRTGTAMGGYLTDVGGPLTDDDIWQLTRWLREKADVMPVEMTHDLVKGDAALGRTAYADHCATCHGASGEGGIGTALGNGTMLALTDDPFLRYAIEHGRDGTPMPAFKGTLNANEIDGVTAFLRSRSSGWAVGKPVLRQPPSLDNYILNPEGSPPHLDLKDGLYVTSATLDRELKAGRRMVLLDTRVTSRWQQGHIEGAVPLPYYSDPKQVLAGLPGDGTWIVAYCECPRAAAESVVKRLRKNGLDHTAVLWEGFQGWASLGHPVVAGDTPMVVTTPPATNAR